jgi:hypothetical protein
MTSNASGPASVSLVVLRATVPDSFPADSAFAFRDLVSQSKPVYFQFFNQGGFLVYFTDSIFDAHGCIDLPSIGGAINDAMTAARQVASSYIAQKL